MTQMLRSASLPPPWGKLRMNDASDMVLGGAPPEWKPDERPLQGDVKMQWRNWCHELAKDISKLLWPRFENGRWRGKVSGMHNLLDADFALLPSLSDYRSLASGPRPIENIEVTKAFKELFSYEDLYGPIPCWSRYYAGVTPAWVSDINDRFNDGGKLCANLILHLKNVIQRPRPYQMALIRGEENFTHFPASSANTPAMVSGHCFQATMGACNVYVGLGEAMDETTLAAISHYAMGIGDRRVIAGVHYPSDNLSSWYAAFRLIPCVYEKENAAEVTKFLWSTITTRSVVYRAIRDHAKGNKKSPYRSVLKVLRKLGRG